MGRSGPRRDFSLEEMAVVWHELLAGKLLQGEKHEDHALRPFVFVGASLLAMHGG